RRPRRRSPRLRGEGRRPRRREKPPTGRNALRVLAVRPVAGGAGSLPANRRRRSSASPLGQRCAMRCDGGEAIAEGPDGGGGSRAGRVGSARRLVTIATAGLLLSGAAHAQSGIELWNI